MLLAKTFLVGLALAVHHLCKYFTKYQAQLLNSLDASTLSTNDKVLIKATLNSIVAICPILDTLVGY